jgi:hypothetical protein
VTRDELIEQIDSRLDHEVSPALARALNGEAHSTDPAAGWRNLAAELRTLADRVATGATPPSNVTRS